MSRDAAVAMAEKIGGTVENFVLMMNQKAKDLGLDNTNFVNPHGLDAEGHYCSARDMATIAKELLKHEDILKYSSIYEEYLTKNNGEKIWLVNTNKLIKFYSGADGLKTGFTKNAGYCLTSSAKKKDLRLITVVMGEQTSNIRTEDTVKLLNYGFNSYKVDLIKSKDESIGKVRVINGNVDYVEVYLKQDATQLLNINDTSQSYYLNVDLMQITAPVKKGEVIGMAQILNNEGNVVKEVELTIKQDIEKANFFDYIKRNMKISLGGKIIINN